jgi:deoxyribose-phosphate aldolase
MGLPLTEIAQMLDLSAVQADDDLAKVLATVDLAKKYHCKAVFVLPCFTAAVKECLADSADTIVGGAVGFPSGGNTTRSKVAEARELLGLGCGELDMVINIPMMLSERFDEVGSDIKAVVEAADGVLVKVILECHYLSPELIRRACDLSIKGGAQFVKTGTGWTTTGATVENISLIKAHVGDAIKIKAAGGIRNLDTLNTMTGLGVSRFGVSLSSARNILANL